MKPDIHTFSSSSVQTESAQLIAHYLSEHLQQKKKIFLLLSGGSAIKMYKEMFDLVMHQVPAAPNLTASLFDERFVEKGHADSNEEQLKQAGILEQLNKLQARWLPYLSNSTQSGDKEAKKISEVFSEAISHHDEIVVLAGMGDDGHTSGLLPVRADSPNRQKVFETDQLITYYKVDPQDSNNPMLKRLTTTPAFIKQADQIFLYATGENKREAFKRFLANAEPMHACPVISLYQAKNAVKVITDLGNLL